MEVELLESILKYLNTRLHPICITQLEIWRTKQESGVKHCEQLPQIMAKFYESSMDHNMVEDLLILFCLSSTSNDKILSEIFMKIKNIEMATDLIDLLQAMQASIDNSARLIGLGEGQGHGYSGQR